MLPGALQRVQIWLPLNSGLQQCCSLSQNLFIFMDLIFTYLFFLFMCVHLPKWAIISYIHILNCFPVDMLPQEFHNSVCVCVRVRCCVWRSSSLFLAVSVSSGSLSPAGCGGQCDNGAGATGSPPWPSRVDALLPARFLSDSSC